MKTVRKARLGKRTRRDSSANKGALPDHILTTRYDAINPPWIDFPDGCLGQFNPTLWADWLADNPCELSRCGAPEEVSDRVWDRIVTAGIASYTYFARGEITGRIKIGKSFRPWERVAQVQYTSGGEPANLLVYIRGGGNERHYQNEFAEWRDCSEWFCPHPDIMAEIERILACPIMSKDFRR